MAARAINPVMQFLDENGHPLNGGRLCTYVAGTNTPVATFNDVNLSVENPVEIPLDDTGSTCDVYLEDGKAYKFIVKDKNGVKFWTKDYVTSYQRTLVGSFPVFVDQETGKICIEKQGITRDLLSNWHNLIPDSRYLKFTDFNGKVVVSLCNDLQTFLANLGGGGYNP